MLKYSLVHYRKVAQLVLVPELALVRHAVFEVVNFTPPALTLWLIWIDDRIRDYLPVGLGLKVERRNLQKVISIGHLV